MARIPSTFRLQQRLNELKLREANLKTRAAQERKVGTGQPRPTITLKYKSIFTEEDFLVNAPRAGVTYFGQAALGLANPDASPRLPRGFKTAKLIATRGRLTPKTVTSELSRRKYLKYTVDGDGNDRVSYSAPISANSVTALKTQVATIMNAKKDDVGEYGRIWFEPERPVYSTTGVGGSAPAP
jgi:hypothetical protein